MGLLNTLTGSTRKWRQAAFEMPMLTRPSDLKPLGADRTGRQWFAHAVHGEVVELPMIDASRQDIPNNIVVDLGSDRFRVFSTPKPWGTYEGLTRTLVQRPVKPPKPLRPIDGLTGMRLAAAQPQKVYASVRAVNIRRAEEPARGAPEILYRLSRAHAEVRLSTDRASLVVSSEAGVLGPGVRELVDATAPLLVAHLRGETLPCTVTKHKTPEPAVTIVLGGAPACAACVGGLS